MFNKYGKKVLSLAMASAMVASMALPTLAADQTVVTATYDEGTVSVSVSGTTANAQINPYGLPYTLEKSDKSTVQVVGQQIATDAVYVANQGDFDLTLGATVTAVPTTGLTLVSKAPTAKTTEKQAFVQLQVASSAVTGDITSKTLGDDIIDEVIKDATWESANSLTLTSDTAGVSGSELATLVAVTVDKSGTSPVTKYQKGSIAVVRLSGSVTESPTTAWASSDKIVATVVYSFKPATT
jgi:hypothetical protein